MNMLVRKAGLGIALGATALTSLAAVPAQAQRWGGYHHGYRDHYRGDAGPAIVAGIAGLAVGAAIASSARRHDYDRRYDYDRGYYRSHGYYPVDGYYARDYRGYYRDCFQRWQWDPYIGRRVLVEYCD